jgi:tetratricopeptide (TPR) repeat protein
MAQALFAQGQYEAAANTTQMAMQMLPETEWGNVVKNYTQLYGNIEDYTNQIRAAEKARDEHPDDGAVRFLLGYHFGYLNYPKQAVRELDAALKIEPRDVGAEKLRDIFAVQAGIPARPHTAEPAAGQPAGIAPGPAAGPQLGPDQKPALPPPSVGTDA